MQKAAHVLNCVHTEPDLPGRGSHNAKAVVKHSHNQGFSGAIWASGAAVWHCANVLHQKFWHNIYIPTYISP